MIAVIQSTDQTIELNGVPARVWTGITERGIRIQLAITRVAVDVDADQTQFLEELAEAHAPVPENPAFSLRMIL